MAGARRRPKLNLETPLADPFIPPDEKFITGEEFDVIVDEYCKAREAVQMGGGRHDVEQFFAAGDVFAEVLRDLATKIVRVAGLAPREAVLAEMVDSALWASDRFDPVKGRAFNFFTIDMLCRLRALYKAGVAR